MLQGRLKIDASELIFFRVIGQVVRRPRIVNVPQFDEYLDRRPIQRGFGLGDVDGPGIEIAGRQFAIGIDIFDVKNITAVWALPAAL